jgi:hypothetical protein
MTSDRFHKQSDGRACEFERASRDAQAENTIGRSRGRRIGCGRDDLPVGSMGLRLWLPLQGEGQELTRPLNLVSRGREYGHGCQSGDGHHDWPIRQQEPGQNSK